MALSIKVKLTIAAIFISFLSYGIAVFLSTQWMAEEIEDNYKDKASLMGTHIIHDIGTAMASEIHGGISDVLRIYREYKGVEEARVFNSRGKEVYVQQQGPPEATVEEVLRTGARIHFQKKINQRDVTTFVIPIENRPECGGCHEKNEKRRGALLLSLNRSEMGKLIGQQRQKYFILFGLIAIAIAVTTIIAVNRLFLKPLKLIQTGAEAIEKGDFGYRIPVKSDDEITDLTWHVNRMAEKLELFFRELGDKNKQLTEQFTLVSRSQKEWQETFDGITDLISVIDKDCNIIKANRAFHHYFSISPYEEINKKCHELFGTCLPSNCPHSKCVQQKAPVTREVRDVKTGKVLQLSVFPNLSKEGEVSYLIFIAKDVTEKKENEMRLIMNERLAALGQMASGIAHEINNPLATISACAEGLIRRVEKGQFNVPLFENYLKMIGEEVDRSKKITTGMLTFVRRTTDEKKEIHIHEALDRTLDLINLQGRLKEVEISRNYREEMPVILGNEGELRQVFLTILLNALDAMENRGKLTLETDVDGDHLSIKISDVGPGIPPHLVGRVFEPFFTTKSEKGGTGLGLSIAKQIIKENNGSIEVASQEKRGTTFTIRLPI